MQRRTLLLAVPLSLVALLVTLAVLQYRWVGELSANERRRMDTSVRASIASMARSLEETIGSAVMAVQTEPADLQRLNALPAAAQWERWAASSDMPELIAVVHVVTIGADGQLNLHRLDRAGRAFIPTAWPPALMSVRDSIAHDTAQKPNEQGRWVDGGAGAIVTRLVDLPFYTTTTALDINELLRRIRERRAATLIGYTIATVDVEHVARVILPSLVRRYMPDGAYRIALVRHSDRRALYLSTPGSLEGADARTDLFTGGALPLLFSVPTNGVPRATTVIGSPRDVAVQIRAARMAASPQRRGPPQWQLLAVHREGSVDAAVSSIRTRNLVVGMTILVILALGIGLVLIYAHRAESLMRQQLEFVSAMSHELRTPVAVVSAAADNMMRGVVETREHARGYGEVLSREAGRLAAMVEQVLEFARSRAAHSYGRTPFDVRSAVRDAVEATEALAAGANRNLDVSVPDDAVIIAGDRDALARAIGNLITNAVKYAGSEPNVRIDLQQRERSVCISVTDDGPGIPAHERARVIEPFFRGRRAVEEQIAGSGLGLALVHRIVEAHEGRLIVDSEEGHGARFTIELRAAS